MAQRAPRGTTKEEAAELAARSLAPISPRTLRIERDYLGSRDFATLGAIPGAAPPQPSFVPPAAAGEYNPHARKQELLASHIDLSAHPGEAPRRPRQLGGGAVPPPPELKDPAILKAEMQASHFQIAGPHDPSAITAEHYRPRVTGPAVAGFTSFGVPGPVASSSASFSARKTEFLKSEWALGDMGAEHPPVNETLSRPRHYATVTPQDVAARAHEASTARARREALLTSQFHLG